jgi:hypothetical protein
MWFYNNYNVFEIIAIILINLTFLNYLCHFNNIKHVAIIIKTAKLTVIFYY